MSIIKAIFRGIIGLVFGLLCALLLAPAFAAFANAEDGGWTSSIFGLVVLIGLLMGVFAPSIRRAFGRGCLALGACLFALPLSVLLLSGRSAGELMAATEGASAGEQIGTAVGAGIGSALMTGASAFVGLILGGIFLIAGLVLTLGGRREVTIRGR